MSSTCIRFVRRLASSTKRAANLEDRGAYDLADQMRDQAQRLRSDARHRAHAHSHSLEPNEYGNSPPEDATSTGLPLNYER
ncbi:MAG: hypothetical protein R3B96_03755 [Pirellulaceae bacterium]